MRAALSESGIPNATTDDAGRPARCRAVYAGGVGLYAQHMENCPNIGPAQRRGRLLAGLASLGLAAVIAVVLTALGAPLALRLVIFLPLLWATYGFFQYREHTCVHLAWRGLRDMDTGAEQVLDGRQRAAANRQARRVHLRAIVAAAAITLLFTLVG
jgi:hypothetical protein